ncbi:MAG: glycosyltransferase, partial [Bacteroidota bacterium]
MKRNDFADTRDISAVIVNWNTSAFLSECLASLRMSGLRPGNMVVVDQGSADDSTAMVRRSFKGVRVIKTLNLGYANGVNAGMSFVSTPYAVIANADVSVLAGCLEHLRAAIQSDETVAMAGSALYNKDLRRVTRFSKTSVTRGLLLEVIPRGLRGLWRDLEHAWHRRNTPFEVSFVEGALFMVRVRHYRNVGGMDEGFSFFFEDADLPIRMIKSGLRVCHVPAARAIHVGGASFSQVPLFHAREFYANLIRLYRRHALRRAEVLRRGLIVLTFFKSVLFSLVHTRQFAERRLRNEAIRSGLLPRQDADPSAAPLVSVIVATADRPAALEKMLLSLNGQSYGNFEIIIVDQSDRPFRWRKRRERVPMRIERLDVKNRAIAK